MCVNFNDTSMNVQIVSSSSISSFHRSLTGVNEMCQLNIKYESCYEVLVYDL